MVLICKDPDDMGGSADCDDMQGHKLMMLSEVINLQHERGMVKGGRLVKADPIPISLRQTNFTTNLTEIMSY